MFRNIAMAVVAALLPFSFTACGAKAGAIYDKDYEPAHTTERWVSDYMTVCDAKGVCRQQYTGSHMETDHHPECYKVMFRNDSGDKGSDCVSPGEYESLEIGDWYEK